MNNHIPDEIKRELERRKRGENSNRQTGGMVSKPRIPVPVWKKPSPPLKPPIVAKPSKINPVFIQRDDAAPAHRADATLQRSSPAQPVADATKFVSPVLKTNPSSSIIFNDSVNFSGDVNAITNGEQWLWSLLEPKIKVLVDVGIYKQLTFADNGRIFQHCFEANPTLCKDLKRFESPTVLINNIGLSSSKGELPYYSHGETMHYRKMLGCKQDCKCKQMVPVTTLDDYCEEHKISNIDFIKIDVEGHELDVLKGSKNMLTKCIKYVQFEYGGTYSSANITLAQVYEFLKQLGFHYIYLICPKHLCPCPEPIENYKYSNYLATKSIPNELATTS